MRAKRWLHALFAVLLLSMSFAIAACGDDDDDDGGGGSDSGAENAAAIESNPDNSKTTITVGSKNFAENKILGEIYAQGFEAAGYTVEKQLNLGDEATALKAIETGDISGYPEYTGTILGSFLEVPSAKTPKDPTEAYNQAKFGAQGARHRCASAHSLRELERGRADKAKADELGVKKISDLAGKDQDLTLYGTPECRQRQDCLLGLQQVYGLDFKKFTPVAVDLRHEVLDKGQADLSIVFTTDPQIERNNEVLLEDDKGMFPPNNSVFIVDDKVVKAAGPDMAKVVEQVQKGLTDKVMQELNARADLDKKTPEAVAGEYLKESGLVN